MFSGLVRRLDTLIDDYSRSKTNVISGIHLINDHKALVYLENKKDVNRKSYMEVERVESSITVNFQHRDDGYIFRASCYDVNTLADAIYHIFIRDYLNGAYVESTEHSQKQID